MNKILNWIFGACFRTLGRFLAIFIVFALLLFIGSKLDLELPSWLGLKVNASENIYSDYWGDLNKQDGTTADRIIAGYYGNTLNENDNYFFYNTTKTPSKINIVSHYDFQFYTNFYNIVDNYNSNTNADGSIDIKNALSVYLLTTNANNVLQSTICKIKENTGAYYIAECPIVAGVKNIRGLRVDLKSNSLGSYLLPVINIGFAKDVLGYIDVNAQNNQIQQETNDKLDDVNQSIQDTNDTLNNNDTSGAQDSAGGFFDDFQSDDFGLSSIVTAPLRGINAMLNDTCIAPSATYKGQTFSLPCGSMLWTRPGGEDFKSFINIMYGGFLAYLVIRKFFLDVEDLKNPNSDKVEVDKL